MKKIYTLSLLACTAITLVSTTHSASEDDYHKYNSAGYPTYNLNSAGSPAYNLAISELRARSLSNYFVQVGVPEDALKIVGRGHEVLAVVDGQKVAGGRKDQWANRRTEIRLIYA